MPNYEIQLPMPLNKVMNDDRIHHDDNDKTKLENLLDNMLKEFDGSFVTKYTDECIDSCIVHFKDHQKALEFNEELHYMLDPRMFLDTEAHNHRYKMLYNHIK